MKIDFLDLARRELDDTFDWYEAQVPGLGYDFLSEVDRTIGRILAYPQSAAILEPGGVAITARHPGQQPAVVGQSQIVNGAPV